MGSAKIQQSTNYKEFEHGVFERPLGCLETLRASMGKHGFLETHPIIVGEKRNGKFPIREGHHRFAAAMSLKIPFYYVVEKQKIHPSELEATTRAWGLKDYVVASIQAGRPGYQELLDYHRRVGIGLSLCANILGEDYGSKQLRNGSFRLAKHKQKMAGAVEEIMAALRHANPRIGRNSSCARALVNMLHVKGFNPMQMVNKIETHPGKLQPQADVYGYMQMLEEVYNHGNRTKVSLAFEAKTAAIERVKHGNRCKAH